MLDIFTVFFSRTLFPVNFFSTANLSVLFFLRVFFPRTFFPISVQENYTCPILSTPHELQFLNIYKNPRSIFVHRIIRFSHAKNVAIYRSTISRIRFKNLCRNQTSLSNILKKSNLFNGSFSCKWVKKSIFFSSLFDCICIQKYACKISGRNSKNCGSHEFFCHVMFDLRFLELKTLNAFFSKPCFSNWRAR